jgi:ferredoxin
MKPIVNDGCIGCELCIQTCPEVFDMKDSLAITKVDKVPCEVKDQCIQAFEECPVECIVLEGYCEERN